MDTETHIETGPDGVQKHTLNFGWVCHWETRERRGTVAESCIWYRFTTPSEFWSWLDTRIGDKQLIWVVAHNWNYDAAILHTSLAVTDFGWRTTVYVNENPPFFLRLRKGKKSVMLVDSLNFYRVPLRDLGESLGLAKLPMPDAGAGQEAWDIYCKRDVEILRRAVLAWRDFVLDQDLGQLRMTLASQAHTAYRHRFMPKKLLVHDNLEALALERDAYCGGRCECFRLGHVDGPLTLVDVNSMYPAVMAANPFPTAFRLVIANPSLKSLTKLSHDWGAIARVRLRTDQPLYPYRYDERLVFPVGEFTVALAGPELTLALERGHVVACELLALYEMGMTFEGYVATMIRLRAEFKAAGNATYSLIAKLLANSLYGKFGQRAPMWEATKWPGTIPEAAWSEIDIESREVTHYRARLGQVQKRLGVGESRESIPALAAFVTAYGRVMLLKLIEEAGWENVFYCDTDSLVVNTKGIDQLYPHLDPSTLGALKVEGVYPHATFHGAKDYVLGETRKIKGVRRNAPEVAPGEFLDERWRSWDWMLAQGTDGYVRVEPVLKGLSRIYRKGRPLSGGRVSPLELSCS